MRNKTSLNSSAQHKPHERMSRRLGNLHISTLVLQVILLMLTAEGWIHLDQQLPRASPHVFLPSSGSIMCSLHRHPHTIPNAEGSHSDSLGTETVGTREVKAARRQIARGERTGEQFLLANALPVLSSWLSCENTAEIKCIPP